MATYSEPPARIRARFKKMETRAHELDVTESRYRRETGRVRAHIDGRLLEFGFIEGYAEYEEEKATGEGRSEITEFSRASRWRLMTTLAKVDRRGPVPIFLTLTYPGQWEPDGRVWKEHLNRFWKKAVRRFEKLAAPWKLEPQARLAPHFHALCFGVSRIPWQWVAVNWACIIHGVKAPRAGGTNGFPIGPGKTGAAEFRHWLDNVCKLPEEVKESIRVGTKIEKLRSWRGVVSYVAKYLAKAVPGAWERVGRYWGVIGRKDMPWSRAPENFVDYRTAVLMRRTARRYLRSRGIRVPHQCRRISIITDNMDVWLRMCEVCCGQAVARTMGAGRGSRVNVTREDVERAAFAPPTPGARIQIGSPWEAGFFARL